MANSTRKNAYGIAVVIAVLIGAAFAFGYSAVTEGALPSDKETTQATGTIAATGTSGTKAAATKSPAAKAAPFTTADAGSCLTWDIGENGTTTNFSQADCAGPHRFEVTSRQDLSAYPSSEFGDLAESPNIQRQAELREELCSAPTLKYLNGKFDPNGRYSISTILPPAESWAAGDRTMLCGVQVVDDLGNVLLTQGNAAVQDQARVAQAGDCVFVDEGAVPHAVPCESNHSYEVTRVVDLAEIFPDQVPTVEAQDEALKPLCTDASLEYVGGDDALYYSTLQTFWTTVPTNQWAGGSHTVNCALFSPTDDGNFAVLAGSAKGPFTINGAPPPAMPSRNPLRTN